MRELSNELATARSRMSLTEQQLSTVHQQIETLENAAALVPGLQAQLATAHVALQNVGNAVAAASPKGIVAPAKKTCTSSPRSFRTFLRQDSPVGTG